MTKDLQKTCENFWPQDNLNFFVQPDFSIWESVCRSSPPNTNVAKSKEFIHSLKKNERPTVLFSIILWWLFWISLTFTETLSSIWTTFLEVCEWNWNLGEKYFGDYGECAMHFTVLYVLPTFRHICMSFARFIHKIRILHRSSSRLLLNPLELSLVVKCQFIGFRLFLPIRR